MRLIEQLDLNTKPYSFAYATETLHAGWEFFHAHQGVEFMYIHEGKGRIILDKKIYEVGPRTLIFYQPYQLHRITIDCGPDDPYIRTILVVDPYSFDPFFKSFPQLHKLYRQIWKGDLESQIISCKERSEVMENLFLGLEQQLTTASLQEETEAVVLTLFSLLGQLRDETPTMSQRSRSNIRMTISSSHVEAIMDWIEDHYKEAVTLQSLSEHLHLSPYHISHLFRDEVGCTVMDYVITRRIREACLLLQSTDNKVHDIAFEVGFMNSSYFVQTFKKVTGITPRKYRLSYSRTD